MSSVFIKLLQKAAKSLASRVDGYCYEADLMGGAADHIKQLEADLLLARSYISALHYSDYIYEQRDIYNANTLKKFESSSNKESNDSSITFPELEVSDRKPCSMCHGTGKVLVHPGEDNAYEMVCEYCGGCGKMGRIRS